MITKKLISLLLLAVMLTSLLISCNGNTREVMELDGHSVTYEVYRYVCVNSRRDIEAELGEDVGHRIKSTKLKLLLKTTSKRALLRCILFALSDATMALSGTTAPSKPL